jgi:flagellar motor switch protein FliM
MPNILNQDEIDSLLTAMDEGEVVEGDGDLGDLNISEYNFRRPNLVTKDQLRSFTNIHETFGNEMASSIALMLKTNVDFGLVSTEQQQYGEFIGSLSATSHAILFTADPLPGIAVLEINLPLIFGIIDMLIGGQGDIETEIRVPTDIEVSILKPFIDRIFQRLSQSWESVISVDIKQDRIECDPEYIQAAPVDAPVVVMAFDAKIGLVNGIINICYPMPMIQTVNEHLAGAVGKMDSYYGRKTDEGTKHKMVEAVLGVPLSITAILGQANIKGSELMKLSTGDVIVLDKNVTQPVRLNIGGKDMFAGRPGKKGEQVSVRINGALMREVEDKLELKID